MEFEGTDYTDFTDFHVLDESVSSKQAEGLKKQQTGSV